MVRSPIVLKQLDSGGQMRRIWSFLGRLEEWTLVFVLLALAIVSFVQVVCRYVVGFSFTWMEEVTRYSSVFIAFLGAAIGVKYGTHFSMIFLYERLSSDRMRQLLMLIVNLICCAVLLVVAWYGWEQAMKLKRFGTLTAVLRIPKYIPYLPIPLFSVVMALRYLLNGGNQLYDFIAGRPFKPLKGREA